MSNNVNTGSENENLLTMAMATIPESAKFDLENDEVVKQVLSIPLVKVLPNSPTVSMLFDSATISLMQIKMHGKDKLYPFEPELAGDTALVPFIHPYQIASGRTSDGEMFLSYCRVPDAENPNRYHTSGIRAMKIALKEPVARRPYRSSDQGYVVARYRVGDDKPIVKAPDYNLNEMLEFAFDGVEVLGAKSVIIQRLKALEEES